MKLRKLILGLLTGIGDAECGVPCNVAGVSGVEASDNNGRYPGVGKGDGVSMLWISADTITCGHVLNVLINIHRIMKLNM